ncbi:MAG TPA: hypothetical protein VNO21_12480 [Polyangiaceae bacterium]|nr:hypothetical protein [Polyangiaceae bacterium]
MQSKAIGKRHQERGPRAGRRPRNHRHPDERTLSKRLAKHLKIYVIREGTHEPVKRGVARLRNPRRRKLALVGDTDHAEKARRGRLEGLPSLVARAAVDGPHDGFDGSCRWLGQHEDDVGPNAIGVALFVLM